jgi:NAD(P)-binding Rossmann-like domain
VCVWRSRRAARPPAAPIAIGSLKVQQASPPTLRGHTQSLTRNVRIRLADQIEDDLPPNRGIRVEQPLDDSHHRDRITEKSPASATSSPTQSADTTINHAERVGIPLATRSGMSDPKLLIVGGGLAGLSAGCYARVNNFAVTIVEHNLALGGVCTAWHRGPYLIDGCIHWLTGGPFQQI